MVLILLTVPWELLAIQMKSKVAGVRSGSQPTWPVELSPSLLLLSPTLLLLPVVPPLLSVAVLGPVVAVVTVLVPVLVPGSVAVVVVPGPVLVPWVSPTLPDPSLLLPALVVGCG